MSQPQDNAHIAKSRTRFVLGGGVMLGITLKVASVFVFVAMSAIIKGAEGVPVGQLVFFRSFFALIPVLIFLAWRRELVEGFKTSRPVGHILRGVIGTMGMFLIFFGLTRLPLPEAITIHYATPLFIVIFSALFLHEKIRLFRWTAVLIGLLGVLIIMWPRLTVFSGDLSAMGPETVGAIAAFCACMVSAVAMLMVRTLVKTERSATIVIYFSIVSAVLGLLTIPFLGWVELSLEQTLALVGAGIAGGIGQILLTESYRHAELSTVAPFEYSSMVLSIATGFIVFGEVPTIQMLIGGSIVVAAGIFIIYREHRLGLDRAKARKVTSPA
ncbi:membrane protein [Pelagibacterium lentulum]|uniref:Membrane protein n=2 Tax=Pelagibacterium lentulum TaxID=2029865 RepID=A0A916RJF3_9HYPH|nr:membrane protein [Pelagibacterium lentulum]